MGKYLKQSHVDPQSLVAREACDHDAEAPPGEEDDDEDDGLYSPAGEDETRTLDDALCKGSEGAHGENGADALGKDHGAEQGMRKKRRAQRGP